MKKIVSMIERELLVLVWTLALHNDFITVLYLEQKMQGCNRSEGNNQNVKQKEKRWHVKAMHCQVRFPLFLSECFPDSLLLTS